MKNFRTYQMAMCLQKSARGVRFRGTAQDQLERALLSIPLNLAEGSAKESAKERRKFYRIALGSLREAQCLLDLYGSKELIQEANRLAAHLYCLCKKT